MNSVSATLAIWICSMALAHATDLSDYLGTWTLQIDQRNLEILTLEESGGAVHGSLERPEHFESIGAIFANIGGSVRRDRVTRAIFEHAVLHLSVSPDGGAKAHYDMTMKLDGGGAWVTLTGPSTFRTRTPLIFTRTDAGATVSADWEPNRAYVQGDGDVPSAEMNSIFDADQQDRNPPIEGASIVPRDEARRKRTLELLSAGALHTGKDYEEAAFVLQHGNASDDFLLAHTLAVVAVSKGDVTAVWIASAALDRYLQSIGQKQIYGTQYRIPAAARIWTQEPYDRALVSDALRAELGVPPEAAQAALLGMLTTLH